MTLKLTSQVGVLSRGQARELGRSIRALGSLSPYSSSRLNWKKTYSTKHDLARLHLGLIIAGAVTQDPVLASLFQEPSSSFLDHNSSNCGNLE